MVKIKTSCLLCGISEASKATRNNPIASLILKSLNTSIRDILNFTNCLDNSPSHPEIEERRGKLSSPPINPEICEFFFSINRRKTYLVSSWFDKRHMYNFEA